MAQRSIGQERIGFAGPERAASSLDKLTELVAWRPVAALLDPLYPAAKGQPARPPLTMFKALLSSPKRFQTLLGAGGRSSNAFGPPSR